MGNSRLAPPGRFPRPGFLVATYVAAVLSLAGLLNETDPLIRATLPVRAVVLVGLAVTVHAGRLPQVRAERMLFWLAAVLMALRGTAFGAVSPFEVALTMVCTSTLMMALALLIAPRRLRLWWLAAGAGMSLATGGMALIPTDPAIFVRSTLYLVLVAVLLVTLEAQAHTTADAWTMAFTDDLTGLENRRAVHTHVGRVLEDRQEGAADALLMVDLDHFKRVNDTLGHQEGDAVLREVAVVLRAIVRESDIVGRWGGEEFVVLLPTADVASALGTAERIRAGIAAATSVTASVGLALAGPDDTVETWLQRADRALYRAKEEGRDRVVVAGQRAQVLPAGQADHTATHQRVIRLLHGSPEPSTGPSAAGLLPRDR